MRNPFVEIKKNIADSQSLISEYLPSEQVNTAQNELYKQLDDHVLQIMLYGAYNAGKSTLINALLGQEQATVNDIPTTDTVDCYDWNGYRLLDTPGVNAPIEHEHTTAEQTKRTQVMLFVIREGDQDSKDLYKRLFEMLKLNKKLFIVLNHQLVSEQDKADAYQKIIQILCRTAPDYGVSDESVQQIQVLPVNAKTALTGRLKNNHPKLLEHSGYTAFIEAFSDWLKANNNKDNHLNQIKSLLNALWYEPALAKLSTHDQSNNREQLTLYRDNKKMLVSQQSSLITESRDFINHQLILIKTDISSCIQSSTDQAQLDSQLQRIIDPIGNKLETWLDTRLGDISSSLTVSVSHELEQSLESGSHNLVDAAVQGLGDIATPDNIKNVLLKGRSLKIPGLKGRWEKTLGNWAGKAAIALQVITALWDFFQAGRTQDEQNAQQRQASVNLYQAVEEVCSTVRRDYCNIAEQVITEILNAQISVLDLKITELNEEDDRHQKHFQTVLDLQAELELIRY